MWQPYNVNHNPVVVTFYCVHSLLSHLEQQWRMAWPRSRAARTFSFEQCRKTHSLVPFNIRSQVKLCQINSRKVTCLLRLQFHRRNNGGCQPGKNLGRFADEKCWTDNRKRRWTLFHNMFWKLMFSLAYLKRSEFSNIQTSWECSQKWDFELEKVLYCLFMF